MKQLVLLRHGESLWNQQNRFTGWVDVDLSPNGLIEAKKAGQLIKESGFQFDCVFTSLLKRAIKTMWITLEESDQAWLPVEKSWRLNERHYGKLQGLNKAETAEKFGDEQVFTWRRSYATPPPELPSEDQQHPSKDRRYAHVPQDQLPSAEALKQTLDRFLPYWTESILPRVQNNERVLIVAHGNSLRALIKHLDKVSDDEITQLNIPTAIPLVYELDENNLPIKNYYLGDAEAAKEAANKVASQAKG